MKNIFYILLFSFVAACTSPENSIDGEIKATETNIDTLEIPDHHTSRLALDWNGFYHGILPCADCEGIETRLILNENLTFELSIRYLGVGDSAWQHETGVFEWSGNNITLLRELNEGEGAVHYKVEENQVVQLDLNGEKIEGELSENYVLKKQD